MTDWLIVAHDAGGAEIVSSWVRHHPEHHYRFLLAGPALQIFAGKITNLAVETDGNVTQLVRQVDAVLTGTGWGSDLERTAILHARNDGVRVAAYLDHWVRYSDRFRLDGRLVLPNEIWVGDSEAYALACREFPNMVVKLEPNLYFEDLKDELARLTPLPRSGKELRILYVCEPILEQVTREYGSLNEWGYTEYDALKLFFCRLSDMKLEEKTVEIRIRQHPSEQRGKYDELLGTFRKYPVEVSNATSLLADCNWADWIVGSESMALVVGLLAKKEVFSCIPAGGAPCGLPHSSIRKF